MKDSTKAIYDELFLRYPILDSVKKEIMDVYETMKACYDHDGKLLVGGNGGSCADALHIQGELMKGFKKKRPISEEEKAALLSVDPEDGKILSEMLENSMMAITLNGAPGLDTAFANDKNADYAYAQQLHGFGRKGDVFLAISTSGNSRNIYHAAVTAKAMGITVIGLTGKTGGRLKDISDIAIVVPEMETFKIQELHLPIYHALCLMLEDNYFDV